MLAVTEKKRLFLKNEYTETMTEKIKHYGEDIV